MPFPRTHIFHDCHNWKFALISEPISKLKQTTKCRTHARCCYFVLYEIVVLDKAFLLSLQSVFRCRSVSSNLKVCCSMPVVVEMAYNVSFDGSPTWKIGSSLVKHVDNKPFVALRPVDCGLVRLLAHNHVDLPAKQRYVLTHCDGYQQLLSLRNEIAFKPTELAESAATGLFAQTAASKPKAKAIKLRASQLQDIRSRPEIIEMELVNVGSNPDLIISVLRPAHPCDHMFVHLDADTIEAVANFIRFHGMSIDALTTRRGYNAGTGFWRNGSAGIVRRMDADEVDIGQKYQRVKADGEHSQPLTDQEILGDKDFGFQSDAPASPLAFCAALSSQSSDE